MSLRDQLLQAGLVTAKQVEKVEQQQGQQQRGQRKGSLPPPPDRQAAQRKAQADKAARDQAYDKARREKSELKQKRAAIHQLVEAQRIPRVDSDERFNFIDGKKVHFVAVNAEVRARIDSGELAVVRHAGHHALVPREAGERIRALDAAMVVDLQAASEAAPAEDDPYKDFVVPDDLKW